MPRKGPAPKRPLINDPVGRFREPRFDRDGQPGFQRESAARPAVVGDVFHVFYSFTPAGKSCTTVQSLVNKGSCCARPHTMMPKAYETRFSLTV